MATLKMAKMRLYPPRDCHFDIPDGWDNAFLLQPLKMLKYYFHRGYNQGKIRIPENRQIHQFFLLSDYG